MTFNEEKVKKPKGKDNFFTDIFDSFKQSVIFLVMIIVYNIIPAGVAFGGYYWVYMSDPWNLANFDTLLTLVKDTIASPTFFLNDTKFEVGIRVRFVKKKLIGNFQVSIVLKWNLKKQKVSTIPF